MIFATDNAAGDKIMADIYTAAAKTIPAMQREARDRKSGQIALELDDPSTASATYEHAPPWAPTAS